MEKKDRLRRIYQEALDLSFSGCTIIEYDEVPTYKLDENMAWVDDSTAVFITCKSDGNYSEPARYYGDKISYHLENLFGFECSVQIL